MALSLRFCAGKEALVGTSLVNRVEAEMVLCLYKELTTADPQLRTRPAIAVISPYKAQASTFRLVRPCHRRRL